jgi:hypothetical protein
VVSEGYDEHKRSMKASRQEKQNREFRGQEPEEKKICECGLQP